MSTMLSEQATRFGRNPRWLEQATIQAIYRYREERRCVKGGGGPDVGRDLDQLALALEARLAYITWLTENSEVVA